MFIDPIHSRERSSIPILIPTAFCSPLERHNSYKYLSKIAGAQETAHASSSSPPRRSGADDREGLTDIIRWDETRRKVARACKTNYCAGATLQDRVQVRNDLLFRPARVR